MAGGGAGEVSAECRSGHLEGEIEAEAAGVHQMERDTQVGDVTGSDSLLGDADLVGLEAHLGEDEETNVEGILEHLDSLLQGLVLCLDDASLLAAEQDLSIRLHVCWTWRLKKKGF